MGTQNFAEFPDGLKMEYLIYLDYLTGMTVDVVPSFIGRLDELLGLPKTEVRYRQIHVQNEAYSCGAALRVIYDDEEYEGEYIESRTEGVKGFVPYFEAKNGDFAFTKDLTKELKEYIDKVMVV